MRPTSQILGRTIAVLVSSSLALLGAWALLDLRPEKPTVQVVDNSREIATVLNSRLAADSAGPGSDSADAGTAPPTWPRALVREPLDEETAKLFFPGIGKNYAYDPDMIIRRRPNLSYRRRFREYAKGGWQVITNSEGLREDEEILSEKPDVRILVTGDSHTDGLCPNRKSLANVLEELLAGRRPEQVVEVLNAGTGSFTFYNYLGVLEHFGNLRPDVFIVVVFGGNDFYKNLSLMRYFERLPPPKKGPYRVSRLVKMHDQTKGLAPQELGQVVYFMNNPEDIELAIDIACSLTAEIARLSSELGSELLFVYLPPPFRGQPHLFADEQRETLDILQIEPEALEVSDLIADGWLDYLREQGIESIDLRPAFQGLEECLYWLSDHHLSIDGHRRVAWWLLPRVHQMLKRRGESEASPQESPPRQR